MHIRKHIPVFQSLSATEQCLRQIKAVARVAPRGCYDKADDLLFKVRDESCGTCVSLATALTY